MQQLSINSVTKTSNFITVDLLQDCWMIQLRMG